MPSHMQQGRDVYAGRVETAPGESPESMPTWQTTDGRTSDRCFALAAIDANPRSLCG